MKRAWIAVPAACVSLSMCVPTNAQEADTPTDTQTEAAAPTTGYFDDAGNWVPPARDAAPDTDNCPQATWPPEPVSTSERAASSPEALPVTYDGPCGVSAADGYEVPDDVLASAWLVADLDSGDVVAMKDPHGRYRPASIIKVLLALTVIDELPLDQKVAVSAESEEDLDEDADGQDGQDGAEDDGEVGRGTSLVEQGPESHAHGPADGDDLGGHEASPREGPALAQAGDEGGQGGREDHQQGGLETRGAQHPGRATQLRRHLVRAGGEAGDHGGDGAGEHHEVRGGVAEAEPQHRERHPGHVGQHHQGREQRAERPSQDADLCEQQAQPDADDHGECEAHDGAAHRRRHCLLDEALGPQRPEGPDDVAGTGDRLTARTGQPREGLPDRHEQDDGGHHPEGQQARMPAEEPEHRLGDT